MYSPCVWMWILCEMHSEGTYVKALAVHVYTVAAVQGSKECL